MSRTPNKYRRPEPYRQLEMLLQRVCEFIDRAERKSLSIHIMSEGLVHDIEDSLSYAAMALCSSDKNKSYKLECLTALKVKLWPITTKLERVFFSVANSRHHFVSTTQYGEILELLNEIDFAYSKIISELETDSII